MRLILHIGTEKTATTTIQAFVRANQEALLAGGIALSDVLEVPANRKLAAYCMPEDVYDSYFTRKGINTPEQRKEHFASFPGEFQQDVLEKSRCAETMFISSEHLHSRLVQLDSIRLLKNLLDPLFSEIRILCYFREQSLVAKSAYSTMVKLSYREEFAKYLESCTTSNLYFNYYESFSRWREVFGSETLVPRIFDRDSFHQSDIRKDVLWNIDPDLDLSRFDYSVDNRNRSLGLAGLELGRINNRINRPYLQDGTINQVHAGINQVIAGSALAEKGCLAYPSAAMIYEKFAESNLAFAREFLGLNRNPFKPPAQEEAIDSSPGDGPPDCPDLQLFLTFFERLLKELRGISPVLDRHAEVLRDLAIRIERNADLTLEDARDLMRIAHLIRPSGPFIRRKLKEYEERLKQEPGR